jgi:hypothetical protein
MVESLAQDKLSSLLGLFVGDKEKMLYSKHLIFFVAYKWAH